MIRQIRSKVRRNCFAASVVIVCFQNPANEEISRLEMALISSREDMIVRQRVSNADAREIQGRSRRSTWGKLDHIDAIGVHPATCASRSCRACRSR